MENELRQRILKALSDNVMLGRGLELDGGRAPKRCPKGYKSHCEDGKPKRKAQKSGRPLTEWQKCVKRWGSIEEAQKHYNKDKKRCQGKKLKRKPKAQKPHHQAGKKLSQEQKNKMREGQEAYLERYRAFKDQGYNVEQAREMAKSKKGGALVGGRHGVGWRKFKHTMEDIGKIAPAVLPFIL